MIAMYRPGWFPALLGILIFRMVTLGAPDAPAPPTTAPEADAFTGQEWELTPYLKGTAAQIRESLNGETERLMARIKETQAEIHQADLDAASDEKALVEAAKKTAPYKQAAADKAQAEADMETTRKTGTAEDRMAASSRFNKARLAMEKIERDAMTGNEALLGDRRTAYNKQKDLKRYSESLTKATTWRNELLDATRNGFMIKGPLQQGSKGTLPRIVIEKILPDQKLMVQFELVTFDMSQPGKDKEGIKVYPATTSHIHILISGIDTTGMKVGEKRSLDHVFVIDGVKRTETDGTVYLASPAQTDADKLFDMIVPLRDLTADAKK